MRTKLGILGVLAALLGAVLLVFGIMKSVSDGAHSEVEATAKSVESGYIWTEAGVLDLVNTKVHVEAKAAEKDATVTVEVARSQDVEEWTQGLASVSVSGLDDWDTLAVTTHEAETEETPALAGGDLWLEEKTGEGSVEFDLEVTEPGATSIIANSSKGTTPELVLSWKRPDGGSMGLPIAVIGALITAIGALLMAMGHRNAKAGAGAADEATDSDTAVKAADAVKAKGTAKDAADSKTTKATAESSAKDGVATAATQKLDAVKTKADAAKAKADASSTGEARTTSEGADSAAKDDTAGKQQGRISLFARDHDSNGNEN